MTYYRIEDGERFEIPDLAELAWEIAHEGQVQPREVVRLVDEICEWNPVAGRGCYERDDPGACDKPARVSVGAKGRWHLCESCARLSDFNRFTARRDLPRRYVDALPDLERAIEAAEAERAPKRGRW